jgi:hypothetical protein
MLVKYVSAYTGCVLHLHPHANLSEHLFGSHVDSDKALCNHTHGVGRIDERSRLIVQRRPVFTVERAEQFDGNGAVFGEQRLFARVEADGQFAAHIRVQLVVQWTQVVQ